MPETPNTAHINGTHLYYEIHGHGPYLILIEGLGAATWLWEKQLPEFSQHFTTVMYDNRGSGLSDKPPGPYSISLLADDLAALMEYLEISQAYILGVSMGGFIAQEFALTSPEKVNRLVLAATGCGGKDQVAMPPEVLKSLMENSGSSRDAIRRKLSLAFSETFMNTPQVEHLIDLRLQTPQPRHAFLAQAEAGATFDRSADIHLITAPTLILAASGDKLVPAENANILARKIPNSQLKIYPGLGHQFWVENAAEFNRDVIEFLAT